MSESIQTTKDKTGKGNNAMKNDANQTKFETIQKCPE